MEIIHFFVCVGVHVGEGNHGENHGRLSELLAESINILLGFMYERINLTRTCIGLLYSCQPYHRPGTPINIKGYDQL